MIFYDTCALVSLVVKFDVFQNFTNLITGTQQLDLFVNYTEKSKSVYIYIPFFFPLACT